MAIDDAVVDTIKARLLMMNKTLDVWSMTEIFFVTILNQPFIINLQL